MGVGIYLNINTCFKSERAQIAMQHNKEYAVNIWIAVNTVVGRSGGKPVSQRGVYRGCQ